MLSRVLDLNKIEREFNKRDKQSLFILIFEFNSCLKSQLVSLFVKLIFFNRLWVKFFHLISIYKGKEV